MLETLPLASAAPAADPWTLLERDFPADGSAAEQLRYMLRYATLAPSSHNTQPWRFRIRPHEVEVRADRTRCLPVLDPLDRELTMSCGAALFHLRLAFSHFGWGGDVTLLPDPADPDLLACIGFGTMCDATPEEELLFQAVPLRRTNRHRFDERPVSGTVVAALHQSAAREGAWLEVVRGEEPRARLADLVAEGERRQWADLRFRRELASWVHPNRSRSRDGLPGYALGLGDLASWAGPLAVRTFDRGDGQAAEDRELIQGSPLLAVLGSEGEGPAQWLAAGQALARVLLRARASGVWASFLNQPVQVPELRARLRDLLGRGGHPQAVLRFGYGPAPRPTPRRPLEDVLL